MFQSRLSEFSLRMLTCAGSISQGSPRSNVNPRKQGAPLLCEREEQAMSLKFSIGLILLVWLGYVLFASSFYVKTFALFN